MNKKLSITNTIIVAVIVGALAFYGGTAYSSSKRPPFVQNGQFSQTGGSNASRFSRGGGMTFGTVLSKDSQGITIKLPTGGSEIVLLSSSTSVGKVATGTVDDLAVGMTVSVSGISNTDGSITAQSVQIRPEGTVLGGQKAGADKPIQN